MSDINKDLVSGMMGKRKAADDRQTTEVQPSDERQTSDVLKRYNVRLQESDWKRLQRAAAAEGTSASAIIRRLVKEYLRGV